MRFKITQNGLWKYGNIYPQGRLAVIKRKKKESLPDWVERSRKELTASDYLDMSELFDSPGFKGSDVSHWVQDVLRA